MEITFKYNNQNKFDRDIEIVSDAWGYADAFLLDGDLTRVKFIERKLERDFKQIAKDLRLQAARDAVTVDE